MRWRLRAPMRIPFGAAITWSLPTTVTSSLRSGLRHGMYVRAGPAHPRSRSALGAGRSLASMGRGPESFTRRQRMGRLRCTRASDWLIFGAAVRGMPPDIARRLRWQWTWERLASSPCRRLRPSQLPKVSARSFGVRRSTEKQWVWYFEGQQLAPNGFDLFPKLVHANNAHRMNKIKYRIIYDWFRASRGQ